MKLPITNRYETHKESLKSSLCIVLYLATLGLRLHISLVSDSIYLYSFILKSAQRCLD